mgnify:FL=1
MSVSKELSPIVEGIHLLSKTVKPVLGPMGGIVLVDNPDTIVDKNTFYRTKDGAKIIDWITLPDKRNLGVRFVKELSQKLKEEVGDGTTTLTIVISKLLEESQKYVVAGYEKQFIIQEIQEVGEEVLKNLKEISVEVTSFEDIFKVAYCASKSREFANLIATAYEYKGVSSRIVIEEVKPTYTEIEHISGMQLDRGYVSNIFVNQENDQCVLTDPLVLVTDYPIETWDSLVTVTDRIKDRESLLIISPRFNDNVIGSLSIIMGRTKKKYCAIRNPGSYLLDNLTEYRLSEYSEDIATYVGANFISKLLGRTLEKIKREDFGSVSKAMIKKHSTVLLNGNGGIAKVSERIRLIEAQTKYLTNSFDRERAKQRISQMNNNIVTIKVGGYSDQEVLQNKRLIEDGIAAVRAGIDNGILPGGGLAFIYALNMYNDKKRVGFNILRKALEEPFSSLVS